MNETVHHPKIFHPKNPNSDIVFCRWFTEILPPFLSHGLGREGDQDDAAVESVDKSWRFGIHLNDATGHFHRNGFFTMALCMTMWLRVLIYQKGFR